MTPPNAAEDRNTGQADGCAQECVFDQVLAPFFREQGPERAELR